MTFTLRPGRPEDAESCGRICFEAFTAISRAHNFPPDFPSADVAINLMTWCLSRPDIYSVIAEQDGRIIGSNFLWEGAAISGVGPITIDPAAQNAGVGRRLMEDVLDRAGWGRRPAAHRHAGVRLLQAGYHGRSLALYTSLGFDAREPIACMQGVRPRVTIPGRTTRPATSADIPACAGLCRRIHGFDRSGELESALAQGGASVVEHDRRISGYTTGIGFFGHSVGESNEDLKALIAADDRGHAISGPGLLIPTRNAEIFRWALRHGLRIIQPLTLMSLGLYQEPRSAWMPSILY